MKVDKMTADKTMVERMSANQITIEIMIEDEIMFNKMTA